MRVLLSVTLAFSAITQQPEVAAPFSCSDLAASFNRPIDDFISEIKKQERKRFRNPLPNTVCVFGFCNQTGVGPDATPNPPVPPLPPPPKRAEVPRGTSSSVDTRLVDSAPQSAHKCAIAERDVVAIAKNVDTADWYFKHKNYKAALNRYQEADEQKPGDPAIHLRLGRTHEMLEQREEARKHYQAAADAREGFWTVEAKEALRRVK